jgi:hypothetical protein
MESVTRLSYNQSRVAELEDEAGYTIKQTISQGLNNGGVVAFRIPADPARFSDLNSIFIRVEFIITEANGRTATTADKKIMLEPGGIHSLFTSCHVKLNDESVSNMTAYPYTAALCRYLGNSKSIREGVWDELDGSWPTLNLAKPETLDVADGRFQKPMASAVGNQVCLGKIHSDVLNSCRQLLPPGTCLDIELRRANDTFSLLSNKAQTVTYKVMLSSVSLYMRRLRLQPQLHAKILGEIKSGAFLQFNRLETRVMSIKATSRVFRWLDCLNGAPLPNRMYIGLVSQAAVFGTLERVSTYFEHFQLTSFNAKLNGRDLLVEPIKTSFTVDATSGATNAAESEAKAAFYSLAEVIGHVTDPTTSLRMSWTDYMRGNLILALELSKSGENPVSAGCLDLELTFDSVSEDCCIFLFTEKTTNLHVIPRL